MANEFGAPPPAPKPKPEKWGPFAFTKAERRRILNVAHRATMGEATITVASLEDLINQIEAIVAEDVEQRC